MMNLRFLLLLFLSVVITGIAKAQYAGDGDICNHLHSTGRVSLLQDDRLTVLLGSQPKTYYANPEQQENASKVRAKGYRIRVYSGNKQATSKSRAYSIQSEMNNRMPELNTYVSFKTPNWRLMVGNFRTTEEANTTLRVLRSEFPQFSKEMFVVSSEIEL